MEYKKYRNPSIIYQGNNLSKLFLFIVPIVTNTICTFNAILKSQNKLINKNKTKLIAVEQSASLFSSLEKWYT